MAAPSLENETLPLQRVPGYGHVYCTMLRDSGLEDVRMARWNRRKYPENWEELSKNCRSAADYTCQDCGYERGQPKKSRAGRTWFDPLDASHDIPNDTHNPDSPLTCRCKSCHRKYDNQFPIEEWKHAEKMNEIAMERSGYSYCDHPDCQGYYLPHSH